MGRGLYALRRRARHAPRPCVGLLGLRARTPPKPRAFPRLTPRLRCLVLIPRRASLLVVRVVRARAAHRADRGPFRAPLYTRRPRLCRTTAESMPSPRRHRWTCALFKAAVPSPPHAITTVPDGSTVPPWPPPPNSPSRASLVPSELPRSFPIAPRT
jgi:hypothetical protein